MEELVDNENEYNIDLKPTKINNLVMLKDLKLVERIATEGMQKEAADLFELINTRSQNKLGAGGTLSLKEEQTKKDERVEESFEKESTAI